METAAKGAKKGSLVTLSDGRQVDSWSEEYRLYCEAQWIFKKFRTKNTRQKHLAAIHEARGRAGYDKVYEEMMRIWKHKTGK